MKRNKGTEENRRKKKERKKPSENGQRNVENRWNKTKKT